MINYFLFFFK